MEIQQIARQAVEASAVLLKNQGMLPLAPGKQVAFFGWAQWDPVLSGNGSGASHSGRNPSFVESCREAGLEAVPAWRTFTSSGWSRRRPLRPRPWSCPS